VDLLGGRECEQWRKPTLVRGTPACRSRRAGGLLPAQRFVRTLGVETMLDSGMLSPAACSSPWPRGYGAAERSAPTASHSSIRPNWSYRPGRHQIAQARKVIERVGRERLVGAVLAVG
jgi:hypothetical protein